MARAWARERPPQTLLGLGKYAKYIQSQDSSYSGRVSLGQEVLTEFNSETGAKIKNSALGGKEVTLSLEGEGTAYYYWNIEGVPVQGVDLTWVKVANYCKFPVGRVRQRGVLQLRQLAGRPFLSTALRPST